MSSLVGDKPGQHKETVSKTNRNKGMPIYHHIFKAVAKQRVLGSYIVKLHLRTRKIYRKGIGRQINYQQSLGCGKGKSSKENIMSRKGEIQRSSDAASPVTEMRSSDMRSCLIKRK